MADVLNTPYLGQGPTTTDNINTRYVGSSSDATETVENPRDYSSVASFSDLVSSTATLDLASGTLLSDVTTASATSATNADNQLQLMESTNTNVTLIYRSGNTTYHWVSSAGSVG